MSTLHALIAGQLAADAEPKTSAAGKLFCKATMRHSDGDATTWVRIVAFGAVAEELAALRKGDAVAVTGRFKASAYLDKHQLPAASIEVVAERLLVPAAPKPRQSGSQA